ncbi:hypothetical protein [Arthrobacter oryzae]|uniref:hypothetical protein n=1 Tax=Arthrobacter oryzae TaxID=409290 RepID=UPI00277DF859|nr:hypothetical protein [Arthrobacter oryzae]MDQ0078240.1 hypothetical protein [Arthrobacter oryzae]
MTTYTSADLSLLAEQIPTLAMDRRLLFILEAEFVKDIDVTLSGGTVSLDTALAIASAGQAPFISLNTLMYEASQLMEALTEDDDGDGLLSEEVLRLISDSTAHNGDVEALVLHWPAQGLVYKWTATPDWRDELVAKIHESLGESLLEAGEEESEQQKIHNAQLRELEAKLAASREFRAASVQKRRAIAEYIAAGISDDLVGSWSFRHALTEAGRVVNRNAFEHEKLLSAQIKDLVTELRTRPDWKRTKNQTGLREATISFLTEKADGYRLSTGFVEHVKDEALGPDRQ